MNRVQVACFSLLASAFLLAGLLVFQISGKVQGNAFEKSAYGEMVIAQRGFSMMTGRTRADEEALFIMHNASGYLLIYTADVSRQRLELRRALPVSRLFNGGGGGNTGGGGGR